jgi:tetratricopeptide (TPR) repeat protein
MRYLGYAEDDADIVTEAARHAREALSLDEADSLAHAILARIFSHELRYDDSINEAQRAVQLNPNHAFAHLSLAVMHIWANRCPEGLEAIDQAIRLSPNDPFMPLMLAAKGVILGETGRVAEAIDTLKASCRLPNADYRSWLFLATYAVAADETSLARDAAAKVLDLMPEFSATVFRRVWIQMDPALHESLARKYIKAGLPE